MLNNRGDLLADWADNLGLVLLNRGRTSTCVHAQFTSVVDISRANPPAYRMVMGCRVDSSIEMLSNHQCIVVETSARSVNAGTQRASPRHFPRWAKRRIDKLLSAAMTRAWAPLSEDVGAVSVVEWLRESLVQISNMSMPRTRADRFRFIGETPKSLP